jgi:hypothetical protein
MAAAPAHSAGTSLWIWLQLNWIWILVVAYWFGGAIVSWIAGVLEVLLHPFLGRGERQLELEIKLERARAQRAQAEAARQVAALPKPGECVHRRVTPILTKTGQGGLEEVSGYLCVHCDTRLPRTWAVREEDL